MSHGSMPVYQVNTSPTAPFGTGQIVQSAVIKVFQGQALQNNELHTLNESIRWLLKTEMGSFITEYFQNQLLTRGLSEVLEQILLSKENDDKLTILSNVWNQLFTETLPTLQAIFHPVQGQDLTIRQMALLAFRDRVLLKLHLEEDLRSAASIPPSITQMLLVLQGVHETSGPSLEYCQLESLLEIVVSPYLHNMTPRGNVVVLDTGPQQPSVLPADPSPPEITITQHQSSSDSSPLSLGVRRHTVANTHSDVRLLLVSNRLQI
ncbi:proline-rich protein 5-like isoform X2 [Gouania willdenowi]|uniref:proline-rich protein 5-like isoform X2 n=1 Tax=Gouania willdenowi TaxID=441366 RepID=UPI0010541914|nr:proline-rich protein 5-like isoform X2 [Gouania willdenowi]